MATPRDENAKEADPSLNAVHEEDNQSQETVPSGRTPDNYEAELIKIFLRVEITSNKRDERGPHLCHSPVLKAIYNLSLIYH